MFWLQVGTWYLIYDMKYLLTGIETLFLFQMEMIDEVHFVRNGGILHVNILRDR